MIPRMILNVKQMLYYEKDTIQAITRNLQLLLTWWEVSESEMLPNKQTMSHD